MKKASVIIPAHNEEIYLEKSLKALKHPDVEVIVVCNGCTDNTEDIARKMGAKIVSLRERGVSKARNKGAEIALTDKLIFVDADIVVAEDTLPKVISSNYNIGVSKAVPDTREFMPVLLMGFKNLINYTGRCTGLIFCDRNVFDKVNGFDEGIQKREDGNFIQSAMKHGKFGVIDSFVVNNMRRYRKKGYARLALYWLREWLYPSANDYEVIR